MYKKKLGDLLVEVGSITPEQLKEALAIQRETSKKLGEVLVEKGFITEKLIYETLEFQLGVPIVEIKKYGIDLKVAKMVPKELAKKHLMVPLKIERGKIVLAMSDPLNVIAIDDVRFITKMEVQPVIALPEEIRLNIEEAFADQQAKKATQELINEFGTTEDQAEAEDEAEIANSPAVMLVNTIISQAVRLKASDIHIEPFGEISKVRFRIDGELKEIQQYPANAHSSISTRIKILANLNIAEKRIPQDGRIEMKIDELSVDFRVSIFPTIFGEKIVIRILNKSSVLLSIDKLGFNDSEMKLLKDMIHRPYGIILVTGPTGSGKSTTLYSILSEINDAKTNIMTIEDPVEYTLQGINQGNVNLKAGFDFASALRSMLRQDPDVIMIGEMRDSETASIGIRAAITGHLVFSTLHTNDAPSSISRLIDMGIEPYMVTSALVGVVSQRLVKKVCPDCAEKYEASYRDKKFLEVDENEKLILTRGKGCKMCNGSGYKGRTGIRETLILNQELREMIEKGCTTDDLREKAIESGMLTLKDSCIRLIKKGITTVDEMLRTIYTEEA